MATKVERKMRFTDAEMGLIKALFADHDEMLFAVRKALLQMDLSAEDQKLIDMLKTPEAEKLIRKVFYPELDPNAPLFQLADMRMALGSDTKELSPEGAWPFIKAKEIEMKYMKRQLDLMFGKEKMEDEKISFEELGKLDTEGHDKEGAFVKMTAWNFIPAFVDTHCQQLQFLAGRKEETVEQTKDRLARNSTK